MISVKKAVKWAYQDFNNAGKSSGQVVYRITFIQHLFDEIYFTIDYIHSENILIYGLTTEELLT